MTIFNLDRIIWRIQQHFLDFPEFRLADAYKLVYQGCMGPEHAASDEDAVWKWLDKEWAGLEPKTGEGLYQDISVHMPIYRINLRAAKALGIKKERIHREFVKLAREFPKEPVYLHEIWSRVSKEVRSGNELVVNPDELETFNLILVENDYPAIHHSQRFREANRPAYRLVNEIIG